MRTTIAFLHSPTSLTFSITSRNLLKKRGDFSSLSASALAARFLASFDFDFSVPTIRHYPVLSTLGERFLQVRWHRPQSQKAGELAIRQQGSEEFIRGRLQQAIKDVFDRSLTFVPTMSVQTSHRIASLAELLAIARTHVFRSNFGKRKIDCVPEAEANTRISKGLAAIAKGVAALNRRRTVAQQDLQDAFRVGLDTISDNRRRLLLSIAQGKNCKTVGLPQTSTYAKSKSLRLWVSSSPKVEFHNSPGKQHRS
jgi:hypothetical protein